MYITRQNPVEYNIVPISGSTMICEIKTKGTKKMVKIGIDMHIHYKHPIHGHMTDVLTSGIQYIYTSMVECVHTVKIKTPQFQSYTKSCIYISIDYSEDIYEKVFIESLTIEEISQYENRKQALIEECKIRIEKLKDQIETGKFNVVCEGLMVGHSGFAKAMRNVTSGLDELGCNVKAIILDTDSMGFLNTEKGKRILRLSKNSDDILSGPSFWIAMNTPLGMRSHANCYSIAYIMFETEDFPHNFVEHLQDNKLDEIWTPSSFCKDSMEKAGLDNIHIMPLGIDEKLFNPEKVQIDRKNINCPLNLEGKYIFLSVMGYSERKGVSILIKSFVEEFEGDKDVALYLKGGWYGIEKAKKEINDLTCNISDPPTIYLDFTIYSDEILAQIYKMANCFVLPTRGEGYCLPAAEAMSMALPTIVTRWGGQLEFANDNNSYLIDIEGTSPEKRCDWITNDYIGRKFAVPSKYHLKRLMRHVFENQKDARQKGKIARKHMLNNFTWNISCKRITDRLKEIAQTL